MRPWLSSTLLAAMVGACFWVPAWPAARGWFPAPLDDVYIHFDFARSFALGHPFEWIPGQGFSSGETSPLYAVVLAIGWAIGFRGKLLGIYAAFIAVLSVASLLRSIARLTRGSFLLALLPLAIGVVDWSLFSGMEVALFVAVLGRMIEALAEKRGGTNEARQWRLGLWGAVLVLARPEALVVIAVFAIAAARGVGRRSATLAIVRTGLPGAVTTLAVLGLNKLGSGDARSAGAQLKLLSSNPYMSDVDRARVFVENLVTFGIKVVAGELAVFGPLALVLLLLGFAARREHRRTAWACLASAFGWILLVSWNGNAPYHNFRYYTPALILLSIAAALGIASLTRRTRWQALIALATIGISAPKVVGQVRHFRSATANIRDQHIEVAQRLAQQLPANARVLLGDAGVIPYVSNLAAIDALGLGGYRAIPFTHAAVHGEAATIELIERMRPEERPTHFALYPNWFGVLTSRFGTEIDRVTIQNNVICGSPTKAIYKADWSGLGSTTMPNVVDELDVGDIVEEEAHGYVAPLPHGGWTTMDILVDASGNRRFDGGRKIPDGKVESFMAKASASTLKMRIDGAAKGVRVRTRAGTADLTLEEPRDGIWRTGSAKVAITAGETVYLEAVGSELRDYHVWLTSD